MDLLLTGGVDAFTALHDAVSCGHADVARLLVRAGGACAAVGKTTSGAACFGSVTLLASHIAS